MEMRPTNAAAINKPRNVAGIDPRVLPVAFLLTSVCMLAGCNLLGVAVFSGTCAVGVWLGKYDHQMIPILILVVKQKKLYDPAKRSYFRLEIRRKDGDA